MKVLYLEEPSRHEVRVNETRYPGCERPPSGAFTTDGIVRHPNGMYEAFCKVQDGTESCGVHHSESYAREKWVEAQKIMNGMNRRPEDVKLFIAQN